MKNGQPKADPELERLRKHLKLCRIIIFLLIGVSLVLSAGHIYTWSLEYFVDSPIFIKRSSPPFYEEVKEIIAPLRYSMIPALEESNIRIEMDFDKGKWYLRNIFDFDTEGDIVLTKGKYGLCGELSAYVYNKIQPIFDKKRYDIKFVEAVETGYFISPSSSHTILKITDKFFRNVFVIDSAFKKYANLNSGEFDNYLFIKELENLDFIEEKSRSRFFPAGVGTPIVIKNEFLIGLVVEKCDNKFDKDNFIIAITATHRNKFAGRYILALRKYNGEPEIIENDLLGNLMLGAEDYKLLKKKIKQWFDEFN